MSLIEKAAERLAQLRKAGVEQSTIPVSNTEAAIRVDARPESQSSNAAAKVVTRRYFELDLDNLANKGFVVPTQPRSRIAEEFRVLKRPLLTNAGSTKQSKVRNANLIMITSAVPGEGKTFTAINLAISIASELNRRVLLVDADVARPSFPSLLGVQSGPGLMDVLGPDKPSLSDVLIRTNIEKLTLLTSGNPHAQATELLASDSMTILLSEMSGRYSDRIVVFDSPPLLVTTESRVLASHMGQVVMVVHAEATLQSEVKKALTTIESCSIKLMVLNQARTTAQGAYGYGYGYGYGA